MKIGFVYDAVYPWETGGVQKRVWEFSKRLAHTHDVHLFGMQYWDGPSVIHRKGVTLHGVCRPGEMYIDDRRSIPQALRYAGRVLQPLLATDLDIIDCQEFPYFPAVSCKLATIRSGPELLMTWHEVWGDYWFEYLGWKGWFGKQIERGVSRLPDAHIAVSNRTAEDLERLSVANAGVIPNGISMDEIDAIAPSRDTVDILFVGRLIPEKNVLTLLDAIRILQERIPDIQCRIVGEGPEASTIDQYILEHDLAGNAERIEFREQHSEIIAMMKAADVFILPSQREGFGMVALEALAAGTPVVTTRHPQNAATELVEHGTTGQICHASAQGIAEAIEIARTYSSKSCRESAKEFEWDVIVNELESVYADVLAW